MPQFFTALILALTAVVLVGAVLFVLGVVGIDMAAGIKAIVVAARHRADHTGHTAHLGGA